MQPITSITIKKDTSKDISIALFDQDDEIIYIHEVDIQVDDPSIVSPRVKSQTQIRLLATAVGSTDITFTAKGVSKVLTVTVVAAVPTDLNVYEGEVTLVGKEVYD